MLSFSSRARNTQGSTMVNNNWKMPRCSSVSVTPLECILTKNERVSPLEFTLTKSLDLNSPGITLLQNKGWGGGSYYFKPLVCAPLRGDEGSCNSVSTKISWARARSRAEGVTMVFGPMKIFSWRVMAERTSFSLTKAETWISGLGGAGVAAGGAVAAGASGVEAEGSGLEIGRAHV